MQSKLLWIIFTVSMALSSPVHAKAEDFFRLNSGGLLISGIEMKYAYVMAMINKEKSSERIGRHRYILHASVGGKFDVQFKFSRGTLTDIDAKQLGRAHH